MDTAVKAGFRIIRFFAAAAARCGLGVLSLLGATEIDCSDCPGRVLIALLGATGAGVLGCDVGELSEEDPIGGLRSASARRGYRHSGGLLRVY